MGRVLATCERVCGLADDEPQYTLDGDERVRGLASALATHYVSVAVR